MTDDSAFPPPPAPQSTGAVQGSPAEVKTSWWRKKLWKLPVWAWITIGLVVIGVAAGGGSKKDDKSTTSSSPDETTVTEVTSKSTEPESTEPQITSAPTDSPTTRAATTTAAPTTTAPAPPVVLQGSGDSVVELPDLDSKVAEIVYTGSGNFVVWTLDQNLEQTDLLVNEIGAYEGRLPINLTTSDQASQLQVEASGDWVITLLPLTQGAHYVVGGSLTGTGPDVLFVPDTAIYTITHDGSANFVLWLYSETETDLVINEIGNYSGDVPLRGPAIVVIEADGNWSLTKK